MLLGLDTNSYHLASGLYEFQPRQGLSLAQILENAASLNLSGVHIANSRLLESDEESYLVGVKQRADELGLYLELGSAGTDVAQLREAIRIAALLGAKVVRTFVGADRQSGWAAWRQQQDRAVDGLRQIVAVARDNGVVVAVENHGDLTSPELVSVLDKVGAEDAVGVCFDTGKSLLVVEDPFVAAQNLAPYVQTACLTDYQLVPTARGAIVVGCALGQGAVDLLSIVQLLRQRRPDLHLNVESPVQQWDLPFLDDKFWDAFYDRGPRDLAAILRLIRRNNMDPAGDYRSPIDLDLSEDDVLRYEEEMLHRSVGYAKRVLLG